MVAGRGSGRTAGVVLLLSTLRGWAELGLHVYSLLRAWTQSSGIGRDRLHFAWVSSAEAQRFAEVVTDTTRSIRDQGRLDADRLGMALEACEMTVNDETVRWLVGKEVRITTRGDVYGRPWDVESYEAVMFKELEREFQKNMIYLAVRDGSTSVRDISRKIQVDLLRVSYLLADLERTNRVEFRGMKERKPVFAAL